MPPLIFVLFLVLSFLLNAYLPIAKITNPLCSSLGIAAVISGILIVGWTVILFKKRKTTLRPRKDPQELEIYGPFRFTRNPIYLGFFLVLLGIDFILGSLAILIVPLLFVIIMSAAVIPTEEKNIEKVFGSQYRDYKRRVRRWL